MLPDLNLQERVTALEKTLEAVRQLLGKSEAFIAPPTRPAPAQWTLTRPARCDRLAWAIFGLLRGAHDRGEQLPTPICVLIAFEKSRPACVLEVRAGEITYEGRHGVGKIADLEALRRRIERMTSDTLHANRAIRSHIRTIGTTAAQPVSIQFAPAHDCANPIPRNPP